MGSLSSPSLLRILTLYVVAAVVTILGLVPQIYFRPYILALDLIVWGGLRYYILQD